MKRFSLVSFILVFTTGGCGQEGLVRIVGVFPVDGARLVFDGGQNQNAAELLTISSDTVDSNPGYCADTDGKCQKEPYGGHYAVLRLVNEHEEDKTNPQFGQVQLRGFSVTLFGLDDNAPELRDQGSSLGLVLGAGEARNLVLPLIDPDMKVAFSASNRGNHYRYSATYVLQFAQRDALRASTSVVLGPYNGCPENLSPVSTCPGLIP